MMVQFRTDATEIHTDHKVTSPRLAMAHMPATGVSGLDLYAKDENGKWRWVSVTRPATQHMKLTIAKDLKPGPRDYAIYLPLYNGTEALKIGVPAGNSFTHRTRTGKTNRLLRHINYARRMCIATGNATPGNSGPAAESPCH